MCSSDLHGSSVHAVFLDASKTFDRVLHMKLFEKLIERKLSMCFERLMKHRHKEQTMQKNGASICLNGIVCLMKSDKGVY